jgi:putative transposase
MADYRRYYVPGGTYFFTVVTRGRARFLCEPAARRILGEKFRECLLRWPFQVNAIVLQPDHLHAIWSMPAGDARYSARWAWIKKEFTKAWLVAGGREERISVARLSRGDHGVWQPRFWEHQIEDEDDFEAHMDYIHYNPVKHGLVTRPKDWPFTSFHRWVSNGVYPPDWACDLDKPMAFHHLDDSAME